MSESNVALYSDAAAIILVAVAGGVTRIMGKFRVLKDAQLGVQLAAMRDDISSLKDLHTQALSAINTLVTDVANIKGFLAGLSGDFGAPMPGQVRLPNPTPKRPV